MAFRCSTGDNRRQENAHWTPKVKEWFAQLVEQTRYCNYDTSAPQTMKFLSFFPARQTEHNIYTDILPTAQNSRHDDKYRPNQQKECHVGDAT